MVGVVILSAICMAGIVFLVCFFVAICDKREPEQSGYALYAPPQPSEADRKQVCPVIRWSDDNARSWSPLSTDDAHRSSMPIMFRPRAKR